MCARRTTVPFHMPLTPSLLTILPSASPMPLYSTEAWAAERKAEPWTCSRVLSKSSGLQISAALPPAPGLA